MEMCSDDSVVLTGTSSSRRCGSLPADSRLTHGSLPAHSRLTRGSVTVQLRLAFAQLPLQFISQRVLSPVGHLHNIIGLQMERERERERG